MGREKGQVSIEAVLILGFFILIFAGITNPAGIRSAVWSNDVAAVTEAQANLDKISSAVEFVAVGQKGTVRTVTIVSNIKNWEINTNAPMDGANPTPRRPVINYEISIWRSVDNIPGQLYRIQTIGGNVWGAVTVLDITGVSTGEAAGLGERSCSHVGNGEGSWDVRIENMADSSAPYIVFNTADHSADCTASSTTINMYLVG